MDKEKRKSLLQMYDLLANALGQIKALTAEGLVDNVFSLLSQLQESAVLVGTTIEGIAGEGTDSVKKLEDLCEQIFVFSEGLESGNSNLDPLVKSLENAKSAFENEFPRIKEVVFLPCSPELWDGFDALYKALANMPDHNVNVIPIPWFDKKSDGELDTSNPHFDTTAYPRYVKLTAFDKYDFAGEHPDIIYIQNAYDSSNLGGSVHPAFYAENLKNYTNELVYIPHFVLDETNIAKANQRHKLWDYLNIPGINSIDRIIVQSENLKLAILYLYAGEEESEYKKMLDAKISFEGFPRTAAVRNVVAESSQKFVPEIPESWKRFIFRENGTKKKVILYSNSIQSLLDKDFRLVSKIKRSLEIFKANSNDIALIWRPHALFGEVADSLRPETVAEFSLVVDEYKAAAFGIMDNSPDPTTAIALSDAYYGDPGSVMELFKVTGRPIMIENTDIE
jgi:hypothetical protein